MAPLILVGKLVTAEAPPSKTYTLLTSIHNNTDDANDADDYNRVIGIEQLNAFSCAKNQNETLQTNWNKMYQKKSLKQKWGKMKQLSNKNWTDIYWNKMSQNGLDLSLQSKTR